MESRIDVRNADCNRIVEQDPDAKKKRFRWRAKE